MKKMTREQARKELEKLKAHAEKLEVFLNEPEDVDWFEISDGESAFYIDPLLTSGHLLLKNCGIDGDRSRSRGFLYPKKRFTSEFVSGVAEKIFAYARLYQLSLEANAKFPRDTDADKDDYFMLDVYGKEIIKAVGYNQRCYKIAGTIDFKTQEAAEYAYNKLENEHKKTLFGNACLFVKNYK